MNETAAAYELLNEIAIIDQLAGTMFERALPRGLTGAQFTVLSHFVRLGHDEQSPAQLANAFQISRATMTSTLGRMARAGLVVVRANPNDGRAKLVALSNEGRAMHGVALSTIAPFLPVVIEAIGTCGIDKALPILKSLRILLDRLRDER